jgi:hypothetical protein
MLEEIFYYHKRSVEETPQRFKRYLCDEIDWDTPCLCVAGARGTGKTTLLIQHYHERYGDVEKCLYVSADNIEVSALGLLTIAKEYFNYDGKALIIDEIHKYPEWQTELKNILDTFKGKKILFSGSSSIELHEGKADLSRRAVYYTLRGLSFREYLEIKRDVTLPVYPIEELLTGHVRIAQEMSSGISILKHFREYLISGYYPFFMEGERSYLSKVFSIIEKVLYEDIAVLGNMKPSNIIVLKKMLWVIATSEPFTVNIEKMSRELGISKEYVYTYLEYLERAGLMSSLREDARGYRMARKPEKIFMENTNLLCAVNRDLKSESSRGQMRETFFVNQLKGVAKITAGVVGDFTIDGKHHFEVGGKGKTFRQLQGAENGYVVADQIEIGHGNKIPLYLFGFLY